MTRTNFSPSLQLCSVHTRRPSRRRVAALGKKQVDTIHLMRILHPKSDSSTRCVCRLWRRHGTTSRRCRSGTRWRTCSRAAPATWRCRCARPRATSRLPSAPAVTSAHPRHDHHVLPATRDMDAACVGGARSLDRPCAWPWRVLVWLLQTYARHCQIASHHTGAISQIGASAEVPASIASLGHKNALRHYQTLQGTQ